MNEGIKLRIIPPLETYTGLVEFVQSGLGKTLLVGLCGALIWASGATYWPLVTVTLLAIAFLPEYRRALIGLATLSRLLFTLGTPLDGRANFYWAMLIFFTFAWASIYLAHQRPDSWFFRRPTRNLICLHIGLVILVSCMPSIATQWIALPILISVFSKYIWFLAYAIADRRNKKSNSALVQISHFQPFWGTPSFFWVSSNVPFPKGANYLARIEATNAHDMAVSQLKGLKLLLWALILKFFLLLSDQLLHGTPGCFSAWLPGTFAIPHLSSAITAHMMGIPYPANLCRLSVIANFGFAILSLSVSGHLVIGICRAAGFNALRNTYRPLSSKSIAEFYNRLYFYFKELLVDLFFYPTYLRYFKKHPRLRLLFATLASAGLGNLIFHFLTNINRAPDTGLIEYCVSFHVYAIYTLILGLSISISQLRSIGLPQGRGNLLDSVMVLSFYAVVMILDCRVEHASIINYSSFIINLAIPLHS